MRYGYLQMITPWLTSVSLSHDRIGLYGRCWMPPKFTNQYTQRQTGAGPRRPLFNLGLVVKQEVARICSTDGRTDTRSVQKRAYDVARERKMLPYVNLSDSGTCTNDFLGIGRVTGRATHYLNRSWPCQTRLQNLHHLRFSEAYLQPKDQLIKIDRGCCTSYTVGTYLDRTVSPIITTDPGNIHQAVGRYNV